ncbi:MAG: dihydropteroate synthase [Acidobacteriota bacterium]
MEVIKTSSESSTRLVWKAGRRPLALGKRTRLAGVVNITPDSFYDGGRYLDPERAVGQALKLAEEGADLIDLGAESTRPGAQPTPLDEELRRLVPVVQALRPQLDIPLMVDTCKSAVARAVLEAGADVINDVSAFRLDAEMPQVIARTGAGAVLMHMRGNPRVMQKIPPSPDIWKEIELYFEQALATARKFKIPRDRIVLDPGIGFGKTVADNLTILNRLPRLGKFRLPVLVGTSRKSFIGKILGLEADERLWGTAGSVAAAALGGAHIVRVHDVSEMKQVLAIADSIAAETPLSEVAGAADD